jgi:hypothetical protein
MKNKAWVLLLSVLLSTPFAHGQVIGQLIPEQKSWLSKANRHEKNGWIYLHIEGAAKERGFQHGYLLASIGNITPGF